MEQEKKFGEGESIWMLILTGLSDVGELVGLAFFGIPVLGQIIFFCAKGFSFLAWAIVQGWLLMKNINSGGGVKSLGGKATDLAKSPTDWTKFLFSGGSLVDLAGVPFAQTIALGFTIYMGNHPKIAKVATVVAVAAATGGAGAAAAAEAGGGAAAATEVTTQGAATAAQGEMAGEGAKTSSLGEGAAQKEISPEALGEEKDSLEEVQGLMENVQDENIVDLRRKMEEETEEEE